jgi:hypothetical protein
MPERALTLLVYVCVAVIVLALTLELLERV